MRHVADAPSPFGGSSRLVQELRTAHIAEMYRRKCGVDVSASFQGHEVIRLYECSLTGYRFWRPAEVAGDEAFYRALSQSWSTYYRTERWEYAEARAALQGVSRVLEVGCGRGYFLKSLEGVVNEALGLELNRDAIAGKVTVFPVEPLLIEDLCSRGGPPYDAVCSFQVLEHIVEPGRFIEAALSCLSTGGLLVFSTPNHSYLPLLEQSDAFDLPPHHMGHFERSTFARIADIFNLDVVALVSEPRSHHPEAVTEATRTRWGYRVLRWVAARIYDSAYAWFKEPGPNLLVIFRKR